ncbi:FAD-binding oxidoreductase [Nocardiopsis sediminis]|uniref:FAD-binding oxidoreductase n=1 Tax=Nocardiopsis sediminis TaxID=1778267 RepID=A0ABV8FJS0_9ACTN
MVRPSTTAQPVTGDDLAHMLASRLETGTVTADPGILAAYRTDHATFTPAGEPAALVRARTTADVAATLRLATELGVPVVPQGARTGLTGGANAVTGCVLLSLEKMDRIIGIDPVEQIGTVQPGVVNAAFSRAAAGEGLFYPPDPASWESSTLGGNIATNAGGFCCVKYGVTRDYVRGLEVVRADGSVMRTGRRTAKGVAGYDLTGLFVGSEGTLGVITEAILALRPATAEPLTAVAFFATAVDACRLIVELMAGTPRLSMVELMDAPSIEAVRTFRDPGFPPGIGAALLVQSDTEAAVAELAGFAALCARHGAEVLTASDREESRMLLEARRMVGPAVESLGTILPDDVCVPRRALPDLLAAVGAIAERTGLTITCAGHAGDGNMHPTIIFDAGDPDQTALARQAFDDIMRLGLDLGGTVTGEHGVGLLKRGWLRTELDPVAAATHDALKRALDPQGILNPGKVIAAPEGG